MRSPAAAIVWEIWSADRGGFVFALGAAPLCAVLYHFAGDAMRHSDSLMLLSYLPLAVSLVVLFKACAYVDIGRRGGAGGFPRRAFYLPVRTSMLVSAPLLFGSTCIAAAWIAWAALVFRPLGVELDVVWPAGLLAAAMIAYQAALWLLAEMRIVRLIVLALGGTAILATVVVAYSGPAGSRSLHGNFAFFLAAASVVAYACALIGVHHQRHGGMTMAARLRTLAGQIDRYVGMRINRRRRPFRSIVAAQCWYEWRRNARVLPIIAGVTLLFGFVSRDNALDKLYWCIGVPIVLAALIGKAFVKPDLWSLQLPVFLALRPISSGQYVQAKLKAAALSVAAMWLMFFLIAPAIILLRCDISPFRLGWQQFASFQPTAVRLLYLVLIAINIVIWTWLLMIGGLSVGMWGRAWSYYLSLVWSFLAVPAIAFVLIWAVVPLFPMIHMENPDLIIRWIPQIGWLLAALFIVKIWLSVFAARSALRRGLLTQRGLCGYLIVWLCATSLVVTLAVVIFGISELGQLYRHTWLRPYLVAIAILQVPLLRMALCPAAISDVRPRLAETK